MRVDELYVALVRSLTSTSEMTFQTHQENRRDAFLNAHQVNQLHLFLRSPQQEQLFDHLYSQHEACSMAGKKLNLLSILLSQWDSLGVLVSEELGLPIRK